MTKTFYDYIENKAHFTDLGQRKKGGLQPGGYLYENGEEAKASWIWKTGGGYLKTPTNKDEHRIKSNICAVLEIYAGTLFQKFVGEEHLPTTKILVSKGNEDPSTWTQDDVEIFVISKLIPDFIDLDRQSIENYEFTPAQLEKIQDDLAKQIIAAFLIGDTDGGPGNLGIVFPESAALPNFYKIDFGVALNTTRKDLGNLSNPLPPLTPETLIRYALYYSETPAPERFVSQRAIDKAIRELATIEPEQLQQVSDVFEPVLTHLRDNSPNFPKKGNDFTGIERYVGHEPNTLATKILSRFNQLRELAATMDNTSSKVLPEISQSMNETASDYRSSLSENDINNNPKDFEQLNSAFKQRIAEVQNATQSVGPDSEKIQDKDEDDSIKFTGGS